MERAYFEPDEFRVNLNSFIQEARNVTFILQKNKDNVPEFDTFYSPWQARLRDDPIMRWVVESRNRITKEGDLETESQNVVTLTADWTNERTRRFEASPALPSTLLVNAVLKKIPRDLITEESLLCVERRWVDAALPGKELLNVSSHVLIVLSILLEAAHAHIQRVCSQCSCDVIESLIEMRKDYPLELARAEQLRKVWVKAENQRRIRYSIQSAKGIRREDAGQFKAAIRARYGPAPTLPADTDTKTLEGAVLFFTERAKKILSSDGYLTPFIFALNSDGELRSLGLSHKDRAEKHIVIRQAASFLATMNVQWALLIGEVWCVPIAELGDKIRHAVDAPNRQEAIAVNGVTKEGLSCNRRVVFSRKGKEIAFGEETADSDTANIMLPIREAISARSRD
jgi:hypothetical protein